MDNNYAAPLRRRHGQRGFTLVEVIVVLSVILLLTSIAVPMLSNYMEDGRRARAESECKTLAAAMMQFCKDVGTYPTRDQAGAATRRYVLVSGATQPTTRPWTANHNWTNWGMSTTRGDTLDNHVLTNAPGGQVAAAYPTTGSMRWRGPYFAGTTPLDPWGRPYVVNVIASFSTHATNYKRMWVMSAGPNGRFDTAAQARSTDEIAGDDIGFLVLQRP